jgi:N6-adenosine-specific RNA methylase IME4
VPADPPEEAEPKGKAAERVAAIAGVGTRSVERAKAVRERDPELFQKVKDGEVTLKRAEKDLRRAEQIQQIREYVPPAGEFPVIAADPPWPYEDELNGSDAARGELPYPPMSLEQICALKVPTAKDCILWLWVTNAHLADGSAAQVLKAWGFIPKTILTWGKDKIGLGRWLRGRTEHCILAVRGAPKVDLRAHSTLIPGKVRAHSQKPDEFYELVEDLCPATPRLEMFARAERAGWVTTGAELPGAPTPMAADLPFLEEALVAYRKGENFCPGCGRTDKEVRSGREGWLHQGGRLSICGRCDKANKVAPQASDEDVAARREVQDATSRKARGKKAPTVGPALSVDRFKGEATDLGFSARLNWTTRLGGPTAVEVLQVRCLTKGCEAPAEDGPGGVVFRVPLSEGRQIDRAQLQQLRDHAQQHRGGKAKGAGRAALGLGRERMGPGRKNAVRDARKAKGRKR